MYIVLYTLQLSVKYVLSDLFDHPLTMQVAKSIKLVMTSRLASLVVTLDMERIRDVQLCIDANIVKESIIQTPKLKLKQEVRIF